MEDSEYRNCVEKEKDNCPYVCKNKYGTWFCGIDKVIQVEYFGCKPTDIAGFKNRKKELLRDL